MVLCVTGCFVVLAVLLLWHVYSDFKYRSELEVRLANTRHWAERDIEALQHRLEKEVDKLKSNGKTSA